MWWIKKYNKKETNQLSFPPPTRTQSIIKQLKKKKKEQKYKQRISNINHRHNHLYLSNLLLRERRLLRFNIKGLKGFFKDF